jgi:hypothetical protein
MRNELEGVVQALSEWSVLCRCRTEFGERCRQGTLLLRTCSTISETAARRVALPKQVLEIVALLNPDRASFIAGSLVLANGDEHKRKRPRARR